jgi:N-acetylmuramoyl-L-alanine amidase
MRQIKEIIIHCSATPLGWMKGSPVEAQRDEIRRWHKAKGWNDIGYHKVIGRGGDVAMGRPDSKIGAHVRGQNRYSLGLCLIGTAKSPDQKFGENFTPAQDKRLRHEIAEWRKKYPTITKVSGHNEYANKACPGFNVSEWYSKKPAVKNSWWQVILSLFEGGQKWPNQ